MKRFLKGLLLLGFAAALTACGAKSETASSVVTVLPEPASSNAATAPARNILCSSRKAALLMQAIFTPG